MDLRDRPHARPGQRDLSPRLGRRGRRGRPAAGRGESRLSPTPAVGGSPMSSRPMSTTTTCRAPSSCAPNDAHRSWRRRGVGTPSTIAKPTTETRSRSAACGSWPRHAGTRRSTWPGRSSRRCLPAVRRADRRQPAREERRAYGPARCRRRRGADSRAVRVAPRTRPTARGRGRAADPRSWQLLLGRPIDGGRTSTIGMNAG